jgi:uncharacterized protein YgbK (DUF1537 family)
VAEHLRRHPGFAVDPAAIINDDGASERARRFVRENVDAEPIVYSTADPVLVADAQRRFGGAAIAATIESFFARLASAVVEDGVVRLVIGGGETSGAVVEALEVTELSVGPQIDPGVPALSARIQGREMRLALKSGNFGASNFFEKALRALEAA